MEARGRLSAARAVASARDPSSLVGVLGDIASGRLKAGSSMKGILAQDERGQMVSIADMASRASVLVANKDPGAEAAVRALLAALMSGPDEGGSDIPPVPTFEGEE